MSFRFPVLGCSCFISTYTLLLFYWIYFLREQYPAILFYHVSLSLSLFFLGFLFSHLIYKKGVMIPIVLT